MRLQSLNRNVIMSDKLIWQGQRKWSIFCSLYLMQIGQLHELSHLFVAFAVIQDIPLTTVDILTLILVYSWNQIHHATEIHQTFMKRKYCTELQVEMLVVLELKYVALWSSFPVGTQIHSVPCWLLSSHRKRDFLLIHFQVTANICNRNNWAFQHCKICSQWIRTECGNSSKLKLQK